VPAADPRDSDTERPSVTLWLTPDRMRLDPPIPANTYHDRFGNFCHVIRAPAGRLTFSTDFLVEDKGEPDATAPQSDALEDLPVEVLIYLLGSRYCETDRLSNMTWSLFGQVRKGWPLVSTGENGFTIELVGEIANMVQLSAGTESLENELYRSSVKVVAGPGYEPDDRI
jgi:hypothetical protein